MSETQSILSNDSSYVVSDTEEYSRTPFQHSLSHHAAYFSGQLSQVLDSDQLDKCLVQQAKLSGKLNNDNQLLTDKTKEVVERLLALQKLYQKYLASSENGPSKLDKLHKDLREIEMRIDKLKYGSHAGKLSLFRKDSVGVVQKYPIEYNSARDKVVERVIDE